MRRLAILLSLLALPLSVSANNIWFDPPNPTNRTPVIAHVQASISCLPNGAQASVNGHLISIGLKQTEPCTVPPPAGGYLFTVDLGVLPAGVYDVIAGYAPPGLLIGLGEATLAVADANAPFTVTPNVTDLGDNITISGLTLPACKDTPAACAAPLVTFGGAPAQIVEFGPPGHLVVRSPLHDPGVVDVVVTYGGNTWTAPAAFDYYKADREMNPAFFDPVLFPVIFSGPGAFGSQWTTDAFMRNDNDFTFPVHSLFDAAVLSLPDTRPPAHSVAKVTQQDRANGYLLFVPRQAAPKLSFSSIIRDLSRQSEAFGTEIPVVHEQDFFDRQFTLLNVPSDSRFRVALRLYRIDGGTTLHYRIRPIVGEDVLVDAFAFLSPVGAEAQPSLTSAFIGDLLTTYPQLAGKGALRIDIDGTSAQLASWAFVTVTNNQTQHVSVISPQ